MNAARWSDLQFETQNLPLTSVEATLRDKAISDVKYNLTIAIPANKDYFLGHFKTQFNLVNSTNLFLDFHGRHIYDVSINGEQADQADLQFTEHRVKVVKESLLKIGQQNEIEFKFENTFVDNSAGLHKYVDPKDKRTYIFSHTEPFFCHRWFPCFDQPSVRATLDL